MLIPLQDLHAKYDLNIKGVIHIGAYKAEEYPAYQEVGVPHTIWIEALPNLADDLKERFKDDDTQRVINAVISDEESKVEFMVTNNEASSSILEFGTHLKHHPRVWEEKRIELQTWPTYHIIRSFSINMTKYNFLNIDIQGAELKALKGLNDDFQNIRNFDYLTMIDYLYLEVNEEEVYKGCALLPELDEFLKDFQRVETDITRYNWGDAFYIRKTLL